MDPSEYQRLASRTECNQWASMSRICNGTGYTEKERLAAIRLLHSAVGLIGDLGEFASAVEKWLFYGQQLDVTNIKEELGDCMWYIAEACNALDLDLGKDVMEPNIRKLQKRYPEKFSEELALEKNRNRATERAIIEETEGQRFVRKQMESRSETPQCPKCRGPLSDIVCARAAEGGRTVTCPNCMSVFAGEDVLHGTT